MNTHQVILSVVFFAVLWNSDAGRADDLTIRKIVENSRVRTEALAKDREALNKQSEVSRARLKQIREIEGWAASGFDDPLSTGGPRFANRSVKVARLHELRGRVVSHLVNLPPSQSTGRIWSGNGLNSLQECLGVSAMQHETFLRSMNAIPENERTPAQKERLEILLSMSADVSMPRQLYSGIDCCRIGEIGKPLPLKLDFRNGAKVEILPLDWPIFLKQQPEFKETLEKISIAKAECISAEDGDYEPLEKLKTAIDDLTKKLVKTRDQHFSSQPARSTPEESLLISEKSTAILKALKFVKTLRLGVVKFVETARQSRVDGYIVDEYEPGGVSDRISLITVLAFMEERGLRFAEANSDPRGARLQIFNEMRDYYGLLYGLSVAVKEQEQEVARVDRLIEQSHQTEQMGLLFDTAAIWLTSQEE